MKISNAEIVEQRLERVRHIQKMLSALSDIKRFVASESRRPVNDTSDGTLYSSLLNAERDAWVDVLIMAMTLPSKERDRVKAAAYERYLAEGYGVAHWFSSTPDPVRWWVADEKAFREMAREAFSPGEGKIVEKQGQHDE